ncbi:sensor histidine kinase [Halobacillus salinarum]|uniref:histidine kinase n=1 Tax=Halobacillus salinarum TaxID=2932257 RepID=A0ABY4EJF1_9BACI|nr:sensor histidine kinase [Halobacillus salinarum]UOQ44221.1 sensor histidine kinase [Halobacillus salinarum]
MSGIKLPRETVMLLPPLISLIMIPQPTIYNYLLFFIFAAAHIISIMNERHRTFYIIVQLTVIAMQGAFFSPWELIFGFYPAMVMGIYPTYRQITKLTLLMFGFFSSAALFYFSTTSDHVFLGWYSLLLMLFWLPYMEKMRRKSKEMRIKLQCANGEIERLIKNEERQRIARDLHDTLGHTLSLITLKSELVERMIDRNPSQARAESREVQRISRSVLLQVRELISDMQTIEIDEECSRAVQICKSAGITCHLEQHGQLESSPVIRNILSMCVRECVTNVVKHSAAKECTIVINNSPGACTLQVEDDGIGIAKKDYGQFGSGLLGMKERLLLIDGQLEVSGKEAEGTIITITVPKVKKSMVSEGIQ